jgi:hypothetical protein
MRYRAYEISDLQAGGPYVNICDSIDGISWDNDAQAFLLRGCVAEISPTPQNHHGLFLKRRLDLMETFE